MAKVNVAGVLKRNVIRKTAADSKSSVFFLPILSGEREIYILMIDLSC